jgi:predicted acyl esterase
MCSFAIPGDMPTDGRIDAGGALNSGARPWTNRSTFSVNPPVDLTLSADRTQGFVAVLLVDEAPDGAQTLITRGFCNLTHRE